MSDDDKIGPERLKELNELLSDAESCARLSDWENDFLDGIRERVLQYGAGMFLSDKQESVLSRIEAKVYA